MNPLKFSGPANSSALDPPTNKRSYFFKCSYTQKTFLNALTHITDIFFWTEMICSLLHLVDSIIKLEFIACCFDGLNGIPSEFFLANFFVGDVLLRSLSQKHLENFLMAFIVLIRHWMGVDCGVFERFAKVGEVVGRFNNSNCHLFNWIEVVALLGGVVQKFFQLCTFI